MNYGTSEPRFKNVDEVPAKAGDSPPKSLLRCSRSIDTLEGVGGHHPHGRQHISPSKRDLFWKSHPMELVDVHTSLERVLGFLKIPPTESWTGVLDIWST
jgi:hypothetical protein